MRGEDWEARPWADEIRIAYAIVKDGPDRIGDRIKTIQRPAPAWTPAAGDMVFVKLSDSRKIVAKVNRCIDAKIELDFGNDERGFENIKDLKPFDPAKWGKPWNEL